MERERAQGEATRLARARSGADGKSAQSDPARRGQLPMHAGLSFSLQATAGNRAFAGLVQRWRDPLVQRMFNHKGKKREATTYKLKDPLPTIHGVSDADLRLLADDEFDYKAIESKADFTKAWAEYQKRHAKKAEVLPLDQEQAGNVTVREFDTVEQTQYAGTVRMTMQLDWLQGKHDGPFMKANTELQARKMAENQMRRSLEQYRELAGGAPFELAKARLGTIFKKGQRVPFDFSVMGKQQSDGLYYEISAKWASEGPTSRHVLVYYHCFPDEKDQKRFGYG